MAMEVVVSLHTIERMQIVVVSACDMAGKKLDSFEKLLGTRTWEVGGLQTEEGSSLVSDHSGQVEVDEAEEVLTYGQVKTRKVEWENTNYHAPYDPKLVCGAEEGGKIALVEVGMVVEEGYYDGDLQWVIVVAVVYHTS